MHLFYSAGLAALLLLSTPWWALQMLRSGKYRAGLAERLGRVPQRVTTGRDARPCIWVHAVSVGEVLAVSGLIAELRRRWPEYRIVVSTTTAAGQKLARERLGDENAFYFPLDFEFAIRPYLLALHPRLVIIAETEFWPNFLRLARRSGARIAVVNARISDRSLPRYRRAKAIVRRVLCWIDVFLAQSEEDARRLIAIGADAARVRVSGNLKFDVQPPKQAPFAAELRERATRSGAFPILVCGSTVAPEEFALLAAFQTVLREYPNGLMVLAPRHPERFEEVAQLVPSFSGSGLEHLRIPNLSFWRRSQLPPDAPLRAGVLLLDSIGELASVSSVTTLAFVGGSMVARGGHNILEPAYFGVPTLVGPHTENFRDIVRIFRAHDAVRVVTGFREGEAKGNLAKTVHALLDDSQDREALGRRAADVLRRGAGATARTADEIEHLLAADREPHPTHGLQ
jgi:3-deoxy-D-manno-octulosonic-acid transferase